MKNKFKIALGIVAILGISIVFQCCGSDGPPTHGQKGKDQSPKTEPTIETEKIFEIIDKIPSPLEISKLIQESGASYNENMLNDVDFAEDYTTKYAQGINLGIYSTDLGYINMYESYTSSLFFLSAIKDVAGELNVDQFFDFKTIRKLAENSENIDSILYISTDGFDRMNSYLRDEGREEVSVLMLVGGWMEALYVLSQVTDKYNTDELKERMGEQKMFVKDIIELINFYENDPYFKKLSAKISELKTIYETVEIKKTEGELIEKEVDGMLVIENTATSEVIMDDATLKALTEKIAEIRNSLTSTK